MISFAPAFTFLALIGGLSNSQVLQRDSAGDARPVVRGSAPAAGQLLERVNDGAWTPAGKVPAGNWSVPLPGLPTGGPYSIALRVEAASGQPGETAEFDEVYVGDLWVLAGQSNMVGRTTIPRGYATDPRVRMLTLTGGPWKLAEHPLHEGRKGPNGTLKGYGPGLAFALELIHHTGVPIGLIPCAQGGTSMAEWSPDLAAKGRASLYGRMLANIAAAGGRVAGILWYQGENDTGPEPASRFQQVFRDFVVRLRADLKQGDIPFYYAQLCRYVTPVKRQYSAWNTVQEAQRLDESLLPNMHLIATVDLPLGEPIHLGPEGVDRVGRRFATAVLGRSGPRLGAIRWVSSAELRIKIEHVHGTLHAPGGRVFGFSAVTPAGEYLPAFWGAWIDAATNEIVLGTTPKYAGTAPFDLWYGRGLDPICNVTDDDDQALPMFGPLRLAPIPGTEKNRPVTH